MECKKHYKKVHGVLLIKEAGKNMQFMGKQYHQCIIAYSLVKKFKKPKTSSGFIIGFGVGGATPGFSVKEYHEGMRISMGTSYKRKSPFDLPDQGGYTAYETRKVIKASLLVGAGAVTASCITSPFGMVIIATAFLEGSLAGATIALLDEAFDLV